MGEIPRPPCGLQRLFLVQRFLNLRGQKQFSQLFTFGFGQFLMVSVQGLDFFEISPRLPSPGQLREECELPARLVAHALRASLVRNGESCTCFKGTCRHGWTML